MKKLLQLLLTFCVVLSTTAQNLKAETSIDSMLIGIDKTTFTTNILYDRVTSFTDLQNYNSDKTKNKSNRVHFEQVLHELYKASNKNTIIDYKELRKRYAPEKPYNQVDIGVIHSSFNTLNYDPYDKETKALRLVDSKFEHVVDSLPPFLEHEVLVCAPLRQYAMGNSITYKFSSDFLFDLGLRKSVKQLTVDFDTNTTYTLVTNGNTKPTAIAINYATSGYKTLTFKATYTDGSSRTTYGKLHVKLPEQSQTLRNDPLIESVNNYVSTIPFQGYDETSPIFGELKYRVFYHINNGNTQRNLLKPIIIIDGFDPEDKRKIQDSDSPLPADDHTSIEDFMRYFVQGNPEPISLIEELRLIGYDVILVNQPTFTRGTKTFDGGADYIERNALNHVSLYQDLNATLLANNSSEELVIVGPSMGGQISRYALAYMEKNNIPHNTRLWVSVDSPHLGANIPVGLQALLNQVKGDNTAAQDFVENQLNSPAAKQQLIEQYNGTNGDQLNANYLDGKTASQGFSSSRGHPFYTQFYNNMFNNGLTNSDGYPQNSRKISIVNGSLSASKAFVNPFSGQQESYSNNSEIGLNIRGFQTVFWFPVHVASLEAYSLPKFGSNSKVSRFKKGFSDNSLYATNINSRGNMDNIPGGWFTSFNEFADAANGSDPVPWPDPFWSWDTISLDGILGIISDLVGGAEMTVYNNKHVSSFIPTVSALGLKNPNFNWSQKLDRNLVCSNEIPFDSYFGPKNNEQHTSFTETSVNWLLEELAGNPQDPHFPINPNALSVNKTIVCNGESAQVFINNLCKVPGDVSSWSTSSNLYIASNNGNSVSVHPTSDSRSIGWVKAHFTNGLSVKKEIWLGKPAKPTYLNGTANPPYGAIVSYYSAPTGGAESYKWYLPSNFGVSPASYNNPTKWWITQGETEQRVYALVGPDDGLVVVKGENKCGRGDYRNLHVTVDKDGVGNGTIGIYPRLDSNESDVIIAPNPIENSVIISLDDLTAKIEEIKIFDFKMNEIKHLKYSQAKQKVQINLDRLSSGLYTFMIYTSEGYFTENVVKK